MAYELYKEQITKLRAEGNGDPKMDLDRLIEDAARNGECDDVQFLLELGALPSEYAIMSACVRGYLECTKPLMSARKATPFTNNKRVFERILCEAVTSPYPTEDVVKYLITEQGVDVNCNEVRLTPLSHAVSYMKPRMVILLLSLGANIDEVVYDHAERLFRANPKGDGQKLMKALSFWKSPVYNLIKRLPEMQRSDRKWILGAILDIAYGNFDKLDWSSDDRIHICVVLMHAINEVAAERRMLKDIKIQNEYVNNEFMKGHFLCTTRYRLSAYAMIWNDLTGKNSTLMPSVISKLEDSQVSPVEWGTHDCIKLLAAVAGMAVMW